MSDSERLCAECSRQLKGRPDKKFCCDACRNSYNNRQNSDHVNLIRNINNALRKNRRILEEVKGSGKTHKCFRTRLQDAGFDFRYHTHLFNNKKGQTYYFCYDFGYLLLEPDHVLVVRANEDLV